jgi:hypothetical protein
VGNVLLTALIMVGTMIPTIVVSAVVTNTVPYSDEALLALSAFMLVNSCAAIYVVLRSTWFNVPLIIDRGLGPIEAIKGSWQLSRGHFWSLFGVSLVLGIILFAGLMSCLIGILFAAPQVMLTWTAGYLLIAGTRPPVHLQPQPDRDWEGRAGPEELRPRP